MDSSWRIAHRGSELLITLAPSYERKQTRNIEIECFSVIGYGYARATTNNIYASFFLMISVIWYDVCLKISADGSK